MTVAYPLQWPQHRSRQPAAKRKPGRFSSRGSRYDRDYRSQKPVTVAEAIERLRSQLDMIGAINVVVSTNIVTKSDGMPRSGVREPDDPGVAVYFQHQSKPVCMPCDTYDTVAMNIAAIAAHIDATRAIERHGVASIAEMFTGFVALPPANDWRRTFNFRPGQDITLDDLERAYRDIAMRSHPDKGGSNQAMAELNAARDTAKKEIGGRAA